VGWGETVIEYDAETDMVSFETKSRLNV